MGIYGENALDYFNAGLIPLPIHPETKKPAVKNHHGYSGETPTRKTILSWCSQFPDHNLAIRLPPFIVGIDVDAYGNKQGKETLEKLESELGSLPPTVISTSRDDGISGIRFYRLSPEFSGIRLIGTIPNHIDVLHWGNRYAMAAPSLHPTGRPYRWLWPSDGPPGVLAGPQSNAVRLGLPAWPEVPLLPVAWCERIRALTQVPTEVTQEYKPKFKTGDGTPAGLAILRKEIETDWPADSAKNGWNNALYVAAARISELISGGELDYAASRQSLINMALAADATMEGIEPTIDSGFRKGLLHPRTLNSREEFALPDGFRSTDVGNSQRLFKLIDGKSKYVLKWNQWIVYDSGVWFVDDNQVKMFGLAKAVAKELHGLALKHSSDSDLRKAILKHAHYSESVAGITAMIKATRDLMPISHEELNQYPEILNVKNGEINLRTGELLPHDPNHLLTVQALVEYDPSATAPIFLKALKRWQPDKDTCEYLQAASGSGLVGRIVEHFFVNYGEGQNGKSKFYGAINHVLGPYYVVPNKALIIRTTHEPHPTVKASLFGKRFAVAAETEKTDRLSESSIKDLTGSDPQTTRRMREDEWKFEYTHTLFIHTNHKPEIRDPGIGMWRRIRVIPWNQTIPDNERDPLLLDKLYTEASGILNWLVAGAIMFLTKGINQEPTSVIQATAEYKNESNEFSKFVDDSTIRGKGGEIKPAELYQEYIKWCKNGSRIAVNNNAFGREMSSLNLPRQLKKGINYYVDIQFARDGLF
jgi:P4 family phage/plasmid primase-like protien